MIMVLVATVSAMAQQEWKNETLKYALYIGPLKAGEASFVTKNTTFEGQKVVRMDLIAKTTSAAEKLFSMNDTLTTYLDPVSTRPVYFRKHCFEGDDTYEEFARFTYPDGGGCQAAMRKNYKSGRVKERTESSDVAVYDMVSVMGYARAMNTSGLTEGKHIDFRLVDAAEILDEVDGEDGKWFLMTSGNVQGYIKSEFFLVGEEAEAKKKEVGVLWGLVKEDYLRVRSEPDMSNNDNVFTHYQKGTLVIIKELKNGWAKIESDESSTGYVYADCIDYWWEFKTAITLKEEAALIR